MSTPDDNDRVVWMRIALSPRTVERLLALSNDCHSAPDRVAASLLHDILAEDEEAHHALVVPAGTHIH